MRVARRRILGIWGNEGEEKEEEEEDDDDDDDDRRVGNGGAFSEGDVSVWLRAMVW